ncbi:hypothetical protein AWH62_00375 [Maricaulis sp. W15]|uniref:hypothetical protein n=1 Tax=Maricaulis sp. W15 TaxID=1772333 RepID=UPI00094917B3|nr:hypothetical protein [Maricaulis sp. W15]OLF81167.1 hypothetical protein AWH62_00375 [Maricaulis sp. W15]
MILTSITQALRTQNWFAVIVEFIIVLAGVVIGFQISAWNETRIEHQREALILERLHTDFTEIETRTATVIEQLDARIEAGHAFEALLRRNQSEVSDLEFFASLQNAIGTPVPNGRSATYAELVASGEMRLIRSEALREALVEFDEQVRRQELAYASLARLITDNAGLLLEVQAYASNDPDSLPPHLYDVFAAIRHSAAVYGAARLTTRANLANRVWHQGTLERARDVLAAMPDDAPEANAP